MELTQLLDRIRAQCRDQSRLPSPGQRHASSGAASHLLPGGPSHAGAAASAVGGGGGGVVSEVATHSRIFSYAFVLSLCHGARARCQPDTPSPQTPDLSTTRADSRLSSAAAAAAVRCFARCFLSKLQAAGFAVITTPVFALFFAGLRRLVHGFVSRWTSPCANST